jgi:hypothetical protein
MDKIKYKITKHISYTFTEEVYAKSSDEALDIASEQMVSNLPVFDYDVLDITAEPIFENIEGIPS